MVRSDAVGVNENACWWQLPLGDAIQASPVLQTAQDTFNVIWQAAGKPADMSLWLCTESAGLHCVQTLYFSPGCTRLAEQFGAKPCQAPSRPTLNWLAGADSAAAR